MIISYNWLCDYLPAGLPGQPDKPDPERLSKILTAIGLEVESLHKYETVKGGMKGLITAEIVTCEKHPGADKLKLTIVNTGNEMLQVVCGASNAAAGQKVILATVGSTIYPLNGEPITIKKAKIRGAESFGMLCAEDEIGLGHNHDGIIVLPAETAVGKPAAGLFDTYEDYIFEIGLTPNRMDAMSHLGVAKDVCAYLSHHDKKETHVKQPYKNGFKAGSGKPVEVILENADACKRYTGVTIKNITVTDSPKWLQQKLTAIGVKPINNIVDITNFVLHESGQPLHAFDSTAIAGNKIIVKTCQEGALFTSLDEKERKLSANDLMICNAEQPMCIAGVYGGLNSGVTNNTTSIFLESAWFNPLYIRKTSLRHGLRTDAATRFEKGVDISNTVNVLKRAAGMIMDICGGEIEGELVDLYPVPAQQTSIGLKFHYLKKLSGKNYHGDSVKNILKALGFEVIKEGIDELWVNVPFSKPDISLPADLVEEIMRIDGLDNIDIPATISISPSADNKTESSVYREKIANMLTGMGFFEIFTNSITNSAYFNEETLENSVKMINNLSAELDVMRPSMLPTGLEVVAHNINRKNADLLLFEFGNTYRKEAAGIYSEQKHLAFYITGDASKPSWNDKAAKADFYFAKAVCEKVIAALGVQQVQFEKLTDDELAPAATITIKNKQVGRLGKVTDTRAKIFGLKQPVYYADINWAALLESRVGSFSYHEISKFPPVQRDLALVVNKNVTYAAIVQMANSLQLPQLQSVKLFDIFESEKLGADKKSMAVNFSFGDQTKTLTDAEIDGMMQQIITAGEKELDAIIRK